MAHIGIIMTGLMGNLNSSLELVARLKAEGHKITYLAVREVREKIELHGIRYVQLPERNIDFLDSNFQIPMSSWLKKFNYHRKHKHRLANDGKQILGLDEYEKIILSLGLDKAIVDQDIHELIFVCNALKIPTTLICNWPNHMGKGLRFPPIRTDIIPYKGFKGSFLNIQANWIFINMKVRLRIFLNKLTFKDYRRQALLNYGRDNRFPVKELRRTNLPPLFSYPKMISLSTTMNELEFPYKRNQYYSYVGPMVFESRDVFHEFESRKNLDTIFAQKKAENKKLILCSVSTYVGGDIDFLRKVIQAVEGMKEWFLIITVGGKLDINSFENIPNNVFLFDWLPQLEVLEKADCNINHAGVNSINECIHYRVPMLVYSGKKFDQNGCAARVHYHKIGIRGDKDLEGPLEIRSKIEEILGNKIYQETMNNFHHRYKEYQKIKLTPLLA